MPGVKIVAVLVRCTESLLLCQSIDTNRLQFSDIEDCTSRLPALIREAREEPEAHRMVVMGRCRWMLEGEGRRFDRDVATTLAPQTSQSPAPRASSAMVARTPQR